MLVHARLSEDNRVRFAYYPTAVLLSGYRREYFCSRDGKIRLTLDREHFAFDQRFGIAPNLTREFSVPNPLVAELKYAVSDKRQGDSVALRMPFRVSRHSKYVVNTSAMLNS